MPRIKGTGKGASDVITLRLEPEVKAFYRTKANEHGIALSEYLRQLLTAGLISENVQTIEARLGAILDRVSQAGGSGSLPDSVVKSILLAEELLTKIVNDNDPQSLYAAQERVQERLAALRREGK